MKRIRIKCSNFLFVVFITMFCLGITIGIVGRVMCVFDNREYNTLQPELFAPDEIAYFLFDDELGQIYVCYNDSSYVNVYSLDGEFLWAVSTPYLRNVYFELIDEQLIIYNDDAYIYNSSNGMFIEKKNADELELQYYWGNNSNRAPIVENYCYDTYQVYRIESNGERTTIVSRPCWYWLFNPLVCFCVSFFGAVGMGIALFLETYKDYKSTKNELGKYHYIKDKKARVILKYFQVTSLVHTMYAILNIALASLLEGALCIGIFPLTIHFIISSAVTWNMIDKINVTENENIVVHFWKSVCLTSFIVAFLSVIIATGLAM